MSKLVVFFSRKGNNYVNGLIKNLSKGNTEVAANMIAEITGADLFKLEPVVEYSTDYTKCTNEAAEDKRKNARPDLIKYPDSLDAYDTIYLGYPNYWGTAPMAVFTFLERYDFSGKTIKPFCTHEGSGMGSSERDINKSCPGATVEKGLAIHGADVNSARKTIEKWV
jgi:flavodoxin